MNAIITPSCLQKYVMWNKVKELNSLGFNKSQISRSLGIYRGTVSKYLNMSESEFMSSNSYHRVYPHKLDSYEEYVHENLRLHPYLSSSQIHDRLREHFPSFVSVNAKTVYNYVQYIRSKYHLPKSTEHSLRTYEKQGEEPFGLYAQADFGERYLSTNNGGSVKVYFFAMVLSRSREKFIYFSLSPFTSSLSIYAHELAFAYYGGSPQKILYDQDKVFLRGENMGDLILTHGFRKFVREAGFEPVFCRKSDPESKGKIENVVKYVKYNFLRGRTFIDLETLNREALAWLERTGNGCVHASTKEIPSEVFNVEKEYLRPYLGIPSLPQVEMKTYYVRKDNTITYRGNFYTLPTGTYQGRNTLVYLEVEEDKLQLFDKETGKTIAIHPLCREKGKLIRNTSHMRNRTISLQELEDKVKASLQSDSLIDSYLDCLHKDKCRYYRDNLTYIDKHHGAFNRETLYKAFVYCQEKSIYNATILIEVARSLQKQSGETSLKKQEPLLHRTAQTYTITPEKTDINVFNAIFQ